MGSLMTDGWRVLEEPNRSQCPSQASSFQRAPGQHAIALQLPQQSQAPCCRSALPALRSMHSDDADGTAAVTPPPLALHHQQVHLLEAPEAVQQAWQRLSYPHVTVAKAKGVKGVASLQLPAQVADPSHPAFGVVLPEPLTIKGQLMPFT